MGLADHIISTPLCILYLEAILLAIPESVPHKVVLTDGKSGETDLKVNKYLQNVYSPNQVQSIPSVQYAFRVL